MQRVDTTSISTIFNMEIKVFDDFLPQDLHKELFDLLVWNSNFPLYPNSSVSYPDDRESDHDHVTNWYLTHAFYGYHKPQSNFCDKILDIFLSRLPDLKCLMRAKLNFYPSTETIYEHGSHVDMNFPNHAAIYSLNTCDGYTRFNNDTKIDSVSNRLIFFDGSINHNSTTTTNAKGRFNINFNYL